MTKILSCFDIKSVNHTIVANKNTFANITYSEYDKVNKYYQATHSGQSLPKIDVTGRNMNYYKIDKKIYEEYLKYHNNQPVIQPTVNKQIIQPMTQKNLPIANQPKIPHEAKVVIRGDNKRPSQQKLRFHNTPDVVINPNNRDLSITLEANQIFPSIMHEQDNMPQMNSQTIHNNPYLTPERKIQHRNYEPRTPTTNYNIDVPEDDTEDDTEDDNTIYRPIKNNRAADNTPQKRRDNTIIKAHQNDHKPNSKDLADSQVKDVINDKSNNSAKYQSKTEIQSNLPDNKLRNIALNAENFRPYNDFDDNGNARQIVSVDEANNKWNYKAIDKTEFDLIRKWYATKQHSQPLEMINVNRVLYIDRYTYNLYIQDQSTHNTQHKISDNQQHIIHLKGGDVENSFVYEHYFDDNGNARQIYDLYNDFDDNGNARQIVSVAEANNKWNYKAIDKTEFDLIRKWYATTYQQPLEVVDIHGALYINKHTYNLYIEDQSKNNTQPNTSDNKLRNIALNAENVRPYNDFDDNGNARQIVSVAEANNKWNYKQIDKTEFDLIRTWYATTYQQPLEVVDIHGALHINKHTYNLYIQDQSKNDIQPNISDDASDIIIQHLEDIDTRNSFVYSIDEFENNLQVQMDVDLNNITLEIVNVIDYNNIKNWCKQQCADKELKVIIDNDDYHLNPRIVELYDEYTEDMLSKNNLQILSQDISQSYSSAIETTKKYKDSPESQSTHDNSGESSPNSQKSFAFGKNTTDSNAFTVANTQGKMPNKIYTHNHCDAPHDNSEEQRDSSENIFKVGVVVAALSGVYGITKYRKSSSASTNYDSQNATP